MDFNRDFRDGKGKKPYKAEENWGKIYEGDAPCLAAFARHGKVCPRKQAFDIPTSRKDGEKWGIPSVVSSRSKG